MVQIFWTISVSSVVLHFAKHKLWLEMREWICVNTNRVYGLITVLKIVQLVPRLPNENNCKLRSAQRALATSGLGHTSTVTKQYVMHGHILRGTSRSTGEFLRKPACLPYPPPLTCTPSPTSRLAPLRSCLCVCALQTCSSTASSPWRTRRSPRCACGLIHTRACTCARIPAVYHMGTRRSPSKLQCFLRLPEYNLHHHHQQQQQQQEHSYGRVGYHEPLSNHTCRVLVRAPC